jgi:hypothetical protein
MSNFNDFLDLIEVNGRFGEPCRFSRDGHLAAAPNASANLEDYR